MKILYIFCILMSLKICKLVIIKPFSLAQLSRRPWGNLLKTSLMWKPNCDVAAEGKMLFIIDDMYSKKYPVKIKRKNILWHGLCFISFPVTAPLWLKQFTHAKYHVWDIVYSGFMLTPNLNIYFEHSCVSGSVNVLV